MLVKNACWWKTCMLVKNLHQHSPPKFHDVGENNVGEIVCWRKKICSFKIICMLVNYVGENFDVHRRYPFSQHLNSPKKCCEKGSLLRKGGNALTKYEWNLRSKIALFGRFWKTSKIKDQLRVNNGRFVSIKV